MNIPTFEYWCMSFPFFYTPGSPLCTLFFTYFPSLIQFGICWVNTYSSTSFFLAVVQYSALLMCHNSFSLSLVGVFRLFPGSCRCKQCFSENPCTEVVVYMWIFRNGIAGLKCLNFNLDRFSQITFQRHYTLPNLLKRLYQCLKLHICLHFGSTVNCQKFWW